MLPLRLILRLTILGIFMCTIPVLAQTFPIRIDASRVGEVWARSSLSGGEFRLISTQTPATYRAIPGERVDLRVVSREGWFVLHQGQRQGVTGPSNITIRLARSWDWGRILALSSCLALGLAIAGVLRQRRKLQMAQKQALLESRKADLAELDHGAPETLEEFKIRGLLGRGGMGEVYLAEDPEGECYALKVSHQSDERNAREWSILSKLDSPHILKAYDFRELRGQSGRTLLITEYLQGETLLNRLKRESKLEPELALEILRQTTLGLVQAHGAGVIHRDIKPENLFLAGSELKPRVVILDFGLAVGTEMVRITAEDMALGTAFYSAPEQMDARNVDHRADLYSLGVVAFEMLTGTRPFEAPEEISLLKAKFKGLSPESLRELVSLGEDLAALLGELLSSDPGERPQVTAEVLARIEHLGTSYHSS